MVTRQEISEAYALYKKWSSSPHCLLGTLRANLIMALQQQRPTRERPDTFMKLLDVAITILAKTGRVTHVFQNRP